MYSLLRFHSSWPLSTSQERDVSGEIPPEAEKSQSITLKSTILAELHNSAHFPKEKYSSVRDLIYLSAFRFWEECCAGLTGLLFLALFSHYYKLWFAAQYLKYVI